MPTVVDASTPADPNGPDRVQFEHVMAAELAHLHHHRHPGQSPRVMERNLIGLALSGGGIRSATINLGVLQALSRMGILPLMDYVSTVSGGGYIGACFSSLLSLNKQRMPGTPPARNTPTAPMPVVQAGGSRVECPAAVIFEALDTPAFSTAWDAFPFRSTRDGEAGRLGTELVAHLRTHGNFLIARRGMLRRETMRGVGNLLTGIGYNIGLFILTLFTCGAFCLTLALQGVPSLPDAIEHPYVARSIHPAVKRALVDEDSVIVRTQVTPCEAPNTNCHEDHHTTRRPPTLWQDVAREVRVAGVALATAWAAWNPWTIDTLQRGWNTAPMPIRILLQLLVLGAMTTFGTFACLCIVRRRYLRAEGSTPVSHLPLRGESEEDVFERRVLQRQAALLVVVGVASIGITHWYEDAGLVTSAQHLVWLFAPLAFFVGARIMSGAIAILFLPDSGMWTRRMRSLWGAYQAITMYGWWSMLVLALLPLAMYALGDHLTGTAVGGLSALGLTRLLAAGLGHPGARRFLLPPAARRILLAFAITLAVGFGVIYFGALLTTRVASAADAAFIALVAFVVLVALGRLVNHNALAPHYFYRDRLAETYLLSELKDREHRLRIYRDAMEMPLHCLHGASVTDTPADQSPAWRNPAPYHLISAAINLAGSRDLTRKDRKSGYWLFSKLYCGSRHTGYRATSRYRQGETKLARAVSVSGAAVSSGIGSQTFFAQAFAFVLFNIRLGYWMENPRKPRSVEASENGVFWPSYLWREVTMQTNEHTDLVNLSDGGHTGDNVGIYPLLERRCKVIVACDAEQDGHLTFGSFTEALRHAYVDMGIDIDIDLTMIRPDPDTGLSRSHCAVGRIKYPDRPDQVSYLIYFKSSLTGDEPEPILNYKARVAAFPHESTADQFFDDTQFESYRALGVHLAEYTFANWASTGALANVY